MSAALHVQKSRVDPYLCVTRKLTTVSTRLHEQCTSQVLNAQAVGAAVVIVANNNVTGFFKIFPETGPSSPNPKIPSASIPASYARPLWSALKGGSRLRVRFLNYTLPTGKNPSSFERSLYSYV